MLPAGCRTGWGKMMTVLGSDSTLLQTMDAHGEGVLLSYVVLCSHCCHVLVLIKVDFHSQTAMDAGSCGDAWRKLNLCKEAVLDRPSNMVSLQLKAW